MKAFGANGSITANESYRKGTRRRSWIVSARKVVDGAILAPQIVPFRRENSIALTL